MFIIKMMTNRQEGYREVATIVDEKEAKKWLRYLKLFNHDIIDIYYIYR